MTWQDAVTPDPAAAAPALAEKLEQGQNAFVGLMKGDFSAGNLMTLWESLGWPITKAIILIIAMFLVAGWARRFITGACRRARVDETLAKFFGNVSRWVVVILGGLAILSTFGVNTASFAAVIAAMGFAIGLALSGTLGNFASGVMLLVFRPFKVGDVVAAGGVTGKIDEIGMFSTTFDTPDNRRIIVPNGSIYGSTIENITHHPKRRVDIGVGTAYSADLDKTRGVLLSAATAVQGRLATEEPVIYLSELGASSIDWAVRVWANTPDYWAVRERLTRDIKVALDNAGIGIPFPQREVHVPSGIEVRVTNR